MRKTVVRKFVDDDAGYLRWIADHADGFVLNTYRQPRANYLRLHRSSCSSVSGTPANGTRWTADYIKICGDAEQLKRWAMDEVAGEVWECARCMSV